MLKIFLTEKRSGIYSTVANIDRRKQLGLINAFADFIRGPRKKSAV
jgi:hypothetical protein